MKAFSFLKSESPLCGASTLGKKWCTYKTLTAQRQPTTLKHTQIVFIILSSNSGFRAESEKKKVNSVTTSRLWVRALWCVSKRLVILQKLFSTSEHPIVVLSTKFISAANHSYLTKPPIVCNHKHRQVLFANFGRGV